jgi:hypothetical protein
MAHSNVFLVKGARPTSYSKPLTTGTEEVIVVLNVFARNDRRMTRDRAINLLRARPSLRTLNRPCKQIPKSPSTPLSCLGWAGSGWHENRASSRQRYTSSSAAHALPPFWTLRGRHANPRLTTRVCLQLRGMGTNRESLELKTVGVPSGGLSTVPSLSRKPDTPVATTVTIPLYRPFLMVTIC